MVDLKNSRSYNIQDRNNIQNSILSSINILNKIFKSSIEKESRRLRGGSWYNANFDCTVLGRFFNEAKNLNYSIGFRIVRTI